MVCLIDTIGLAGCGTNSPVSGLLVNSLPGIDRESIEKIADSDQKTGVNAWADVQSRASARFAVDVRALFNKRFSLKTISASFDLGNLIDTTSTTAAAVQYRGIAFDLDYGLDDWHKNSALQSHYIQSLKFYAGGAYGATTIKVYDIDTGNQIDSLTATLVSGWNTVQVNKYYSERRIFIGIDSTAITSVELEIKSTCEDCSVNIQGASIGIGADISTLTKGTNSFGMSAVYGVHCKIDPIICNNLSAFYQPWWYCLGSELQTETLFSPRTNHKTLDREKAKELKDFFDVQYEQALRLSVDGINLDVNDYCLVCNDPYQITESRP